MSGYINNNDDIEKDLEELPVKVSEALLSWRKASLEREKVQALLYLQFKMSPNKQTENEIKARVESSDERYGIALKEAEAEANYNYLYERLLSVKKISGLRTAF